MKVDLICSDKTRAILLELLSARNMEVDDSSGVCILEAGCPAPAQKVSLLFDLSTLHVLLELLDRLSKSPDESSNTVIGKCSDGNLEIIPYKRICFFEGRGNNTFCITKDGEYRIKGKLYELDASLPKNRFIRVGKSFIVNIENVRQIVPWFGRRLVLKFIDSKKEVEVSKNFTKSFKEFLDL